MYEASDISARKRIVESLMILCGMAILVSSYLNLSKANVFPKSGKVAEYTGVVRSEPVATEVRSRLAGRLVTVAVQEGSPVKAGDIVARVEPDGTQSGLGALRLEAATLAMQKAALTAEKLGQDTIAPISSGELQEDWPASAVELLKDLKASYRQSMEKQKKLSQQRQDTESRRLDRLNRKMETQNFIRKKCEEQLQSLNAERGRIEGLVAHGTFPLNRYSDLERQVMAVQLRLAEADVQLSEIEEERDSLGLAAAEQAKTRFEDLVARERDLALKIEDVKRRIAVQLAANERTEIRAPHEGVIRNVRLATAGMKVEEGEPLFDVQKSDQTYLVEVKMPADEKLEVAPGDRAQVKPGFRGVASMSGFWAVVDGVMTDEMEDGTGGISARTVYVAVSDDSVPAIQRQKFRTGYSVSVMMGAADSVSQNSVAPVSRRTTRGERYSPPT